MGLHVHRCLHIRVFINRLVKFVNMFMLKRDVTPRCYQWSYIHLMFMISLHWYMYIEYWYCLMWWYHFQIRNWYANRENVFEIWIYWHLFIMFYCANIVTLNDNVLVYSRHVLLHVWEVYCLLWNYYALFFLRPCLHPAILSCTSAKYP